MSNDMTLYSILLRELDMLITPLTSASENPDTLEEFLRAAGLSHLIGNRFDTLAASLVESLQRATTILSSIAQDNTLQAGPSELSAALSALDNVLTLAEDLGNITGTIEAELGVTLDLADLGGLPIRGEDILSSIWHILLYRRIQTLEPAFISVGEILGMITPARNGMGPRVDAGALTDFLKDPDAVLRASIGWGSAELTLDPILDAITSMAFWVGLMARLEMFEGEDGKDVLSIFIKLAEAQNLGGTIEGGLRIGVRQTAPVAQIEIATYSNLDFATSVKLTDQTVLTIALDAQAGGFPVLLLGPEGASVSQGGTPNGGLTISLTQLSAENERLTLVPFGALGGVYADSISIGADIDTDNLDVSLVAHVKKGSVEINPDKLDGFLSLLLPDSGIKAPFNLSAHLSSRDGFSIGGGAGLDIDIPVTTGVLDIFSIDMLHLRGAINKADATLEVGVTGSGMIGPFSAVIERIGIDAKVSLGESSGTGTIATIGNVSLALGFRPPTGIGLGLDFGPISGGGFLSLDSDAGRYAGALALTVETLGLSAFGVISTRMPDGSDGFSMLAFIRGEFPPIPLGFGFTLNGVGGLLGINRDLNADALFAAVRSGQIGKLLAPEDPLRNASSLIAQAEAIFPVYDGRHVFGPTVQIGWGAPRSLITLDLALGLTLPEPIRIFVIGRVRARLPDENLPLIKLNIDVAGLLDLGAGKFDMEGRLFDSYYSGIAVEGGFAVQMRWGGRNSFAFSVGGLHPGFQPPTGFPELPRAGVSLAKSRNFTLQLMGYFAITSNSLQFGAAADLIARASGYGLEAHLGFDALIIFDPFGLDAQLRASARIFKGSSTLMKLSLKGRLRGPGPWSVNGSVTFEILFIDIEIGFSKSFGQDASRSSERVDVGALMDATLTESIRWAASGSGPVLARPEANGLAPTKEIRFSQDLLPFETTLEHFGGVEIVGPRRFKMTSISLAGQSVAVGRSPKEAFAPGTYLALTEKERLTAPAYEDLPSGGVVSAAKAVANGVSAERNMVRRVVLIDAAPGEVLGPQTRDLIGWVSPDLEPAQPLPPPRGQVKLNQEQFVGGTIDTHQRGVGSYTAARAAGLGGVMRQAEL